MMDYTEKRVLEFAPIGKQVCKALKDKAVQLGVAEEEEDVAPWGQGRFTLSRDPFSGQDSLIGSWCNDSGMECGRILFHGDGSVYAEFDVLKPHPVLPGMQILAIEAWVKNGAIKTDLKLLADPESGAVP